jgi:hypothetical protein
LILIQLEELRDQAKSLAEFLIDNLGTRIRVRVNGSTVQVDAPHTKDVKLAVHKFLYHNALADYRIVTAQKTLTILPPKKEPRQASTPQVNSGAGLSPFSPYRVNSLSSVEFSNYPAPSPRKFKQPKKKRQT